MLGKFDSILTSFLFFITSILSEWGSFSSSYFYHSTLLTIGNQNERLNSLSKQLEAALKQVQDLAVKAIEGSANANSYQTLKEITLEQAKSQAKTK